MTDTDIDVNDLVEQHKEETEGGRTATEAAVEQTDDTPDPVDAIADAYEQIDNGDLSSNLTLRDENLAALFHGLEAADELGTVGADAAAQLDRDGDISNRAAVLRLLVRIGLVEVDSKLIETGKAGRRQFLESDEF